MAEQLDTQLAAALNNLNVTETQETTPEPVVHTESTLRYEPVVHTEPTLNSEDAKDVAEETNNEETNNEEDRPTEYIQITVKTISGQTIAIELDPTGPVSMLMEKIRVKLGVSPAEQRLIFSGKQLDPIQPLNAYDVEEGSCITLVLRLRGGC